MTPPEPTWTVLVSCEHAGNRVPRPYVHLFRKQTAVLASHRGWDPGALPLARALARHFSAPLFVTTTTRLLVEPNRSPHHPRQFSEYTRELPREEREQIANKYYYPHRSRVEQAIRCSLESGQRVLHCSAHSFTPILDGEERRTDIGILYDPARPLEREMGGAWCDAWKQIAPERLIRKNYPYRGAADGLTTYLRRQFPARRYLGIELELNQKWFGTNHWTTLCRQAATSLATALHLISPSSPHRDSSGASRHGPRLTR